jgi:hypothetical protein
VAPLPSSLQPTADPDAALTTRIKSALAALGQGGEALSAARDITPGAKNDFSGGTGADLAGAATMAYLGQEDVAGRGIRRHGGEVARVRLYKLQTPSGSRYLLVHLTSDGSVTDIDMVER